MRMIGQRVAQGGAILVGARLLTRMIDLATLLVLARVLRPIDFGLVAIAMGLLLIVETALEMPINQALVRLPAISREQYDTAFTLGLLRSLFMGTLLVAAAWPFAQFYHDPRLAALLCVLSLSSVSRGLYSPYLAGYQKNMSFWRDLVMEVGGKSMGFTVSVTVALLTGSYWAIAAGTVATPITTLIISYFVAPYRPRLTLASLGVFKGFVGWSSAAQMFSSVNWQFERLLLGKIQSTRSLGLFSTANDIASIPFLAMFGPILRPLLAAFSMLLDDRARLAKSYQTASTAVVTVGLPLLVGECILAEPAVRLILGAQWLSATPLLRWLALSTIPALLALPAGPLVMSFGETKLLLHRNALEFCIKFPIALIGGLTFGFFGVIFARFVSELAAGIFCMAVVKRHLALPITAQLFAYWRCIVSTLVMIVPVLECNAKLLDLGGSSGAALTFFVSAAVGATVYAAVLGILWRLSGYPTGIESMTMNTIARFLRKTRQTRPALQA
jgi:PST family polysaccharide transporter